MRREEKSMRLEGKCNEGKLKTMVQYSVVVQMEPCEPWIAGSAQKT